MDWHVLEKVWALFAALGALWMRLEVGMALNRREIAALWARRKEERDELAAQFQQYRDDQKEFRSEMRDEMKALRDALAALQR